MHFQLPNGVTKYIERQLTEQIAAMILKVI